MKRTYRPLRRHLHPASPARMRIIASLVVGAALLAAQSATGAEIKDAPRFPNKADYSSAKDWNLKAENIVPHGRNPRTCRRPADAPERRSSRCSNPTS